MQAAAGVLEVLEVLEVVLQRRVGMVALDQHLLFQAQL
jgi:hypothetical protein